MEVCYGFLMKTVLIRQSCFCYWAEFTESRPFLLLNPPVIVQEVHKDLEEDTARTADPEWLKGYSRPHCTMFDYKSGGEAGWGTRLEWWHLSCQVTAMWDGAWLNTCLPRGNSELIPCFPLLAFFWFYLLNCVNLWVFSLFIQFFSPCLQQGMSKWLCGAVLLPEVNLQQPFLAPSTGLGGFQIATDLIGICWIELLLLFSC